MASKDLDYVSYNSYRQLLWYVFMPFLSFVVWKKQREQSNIFFEFHERNKIGWNDMRITFWLNSSFKSAVMMPLPREHSDIRHMPSGIYMPQKNGIVLAVIF